MKRPRALELVGVTLFFCLGAVVFTYPLITRMSDHLVGQLGDNIYFVWMIGWFKKALFSLGADPLNIWFLNYPEGWNLAYTEITPAMLGLAMPFALAGGPTFGYNAAMLLSFVLSGLGMYLWVRDISGSPFGALLAGTAFAFMPFRVAHFLI
ncbi:MAG: hypothetical protein HPY76_12565, partial [Anaerolineae bacterium]|nr:hypothetical protein [Anaerolineae bacterium]